MRTLLANLCLALGILSATQSLFAADCGQAIGRIDGIVVNGSGIDEAPKDAVSLLRNAKTVPVTNGIPVCSGDVISTSKNASLTVRLGDGAARDHPITIYAGSTT